MTKDIKNTQVLDTSSKTTSEEKKDGEKVFTQEEVNALIGKYRSEDKEKLEKEFTEKLERTKEELQKTLEVEKAEAERLAKLSAEEKEKELLSKQAEANKQKETELKLWENRLKATSKLDELGVPIKLVDYVVSTDDKQMDERITNLKEAFDSAVEKGVAERLDGSSKKDVSTKKTTPIELKRVF